MAKYKGNAVIYGANGSVTLAGSATVLTNDQTSASWTDDSPMQRFSDSSGIPRTLVLPYKEFTLTLALRVGVGTSHTPADLKTLAALVRKGDTIVTSGFDVATMNWDSNASGYVESVSWNPEAEGAGVLNVTAKRVTDVSDVAIPFGAAWASL